VPDLLSRSRYTAARHILTSPAISARTGEHVRDGRIDWHGVLAESTTMSGGERYLVDVARRIWAGEPLPGSYELQGQLDVGNARRVAEALDSLAEIESQMPGFAAAG
jgi:hypothetical protein